METQNKIETISCLEVAHMLGTHPTVVKAGIKNGTLPIGFVGQGRGEKERIIIPRARWEAWVNAKDLTKSE